MIRRELPILIALFLDLAGFGMAFPDIQIRAEEMGAPGWMIGLLLASLFAVQFVVSPRWGKLSDHVGRKPVAVFCTALSAASMVVYALTDSLWGILLSRVLAGFAAANVVVAQAYTADITSEEDRGPAMGRIGAAISVGLIAGPFFGGQLVELGGSRLMGFIAAGASTLAALILFLSMEHRPPTEARQPGKSPIIDLRLLKDFPALRRLAALAAIAWFALACLEGTFGRLIAHKFDFPVSLVGLTMSKPQGASGAIFGLESLVSFAIQGLFFAWIAKRMQVGSMLRFGYILQGVGLLLTPFAPGLGLICLFSVIYSAGGAISNPTVNTACSNLVPEARQGELFGLLQAARSIGFLLGPLLGGALFDWHSYAPYVLAGGVAVFAALMVPSKDTLVSETA